MKKFIICLVFAFSVILTLSACRSLDTTSETTPSASTTTIQTPAEDIPVSISPESSVSESAESTMDASPDTATETPLTVDVQSDTDGPQGTDDIETFDSNTSESDAPEQDTPEDIAEEAAEKAQPSVVPVLYYHSVSDEPVGIRILSVTTADFEAQLQYLLENGYTPIYMDEYPSLYEKPVIITFDDGYEDNYTNVYPLLLKYNVKATIFIFKDAVNTPGYLSEVQITSMPFVSFQSHTVTHRRLTELSEEQIIMELTESKDYISQLTRKNVFAICYPYGKFNDTVIRLASEYYSCGLTIMEGVESEILNNYRIVRVFVSRDDTLEDFKRAIVYGT